jgi:hypothetical protein
MELAPPVVELHAAEFAMVQSASGEPLGQVQETSMHPVDAVALQQACDAKCGTERAARMRAEVQQKPPRRYDYGFAFDAFPPRHFPETIQETPVNPVHPPPALRTLFRLQTVSVISQFAETVQAA